MMNSMNPKAHECDLDVFLLTKGNESDLRDQSDLTLVTVGQHVIKTGTWHR